MLRSAKQGVWGIGGAMAGLRLATMDLIERYIFIRLKDRRYALPIGSMP